MRGGTRRKRLFSRCFCDVPHDVRCRQDAVIAAESGESGHIIIDRSALTAQRSADDGPRADNVSTWAMLIKRVYEVDPLECPQCGGAMKVISFIERRQQDVIERILRHCGLWEGPNKLCSC